MKHTPERSKKRSLIDEAVGLAVTMGRYPLAEKAANRGKEGQPIDRVMAGVVALDWADGEFCAG